MTTSAYILQSNSLLLFTIGAALIGKGVWDLDDGVVAWLTSLSDGHDLTIRQYNMMAVALAVSVIGCILVYWSVIYGPPITNDSSNSSLNGLNGTTGAAKP